MVSLDQPFGFNQLRLIGYCFIFVPVSQQAICQTDTLLRDYVRETVFMAWCAPVLHFASMSQFFSNLECTPFHSRLYAIIDEDPTEIFAFARQAKGSV